MRQIGLALLLPLLLTACGTTGPLYLPGAPSTPAQTQTPPQTP